MPPIGAAFGLTRLMAKLLFGVGSADPLTFSIVPIVLVLVAATAGACLVPAWRAGRIDPAGALRCE